VLLQVAAEVDFRKESTDELRGIAACQKRNLNWSLLLLGLFLFYRSLLLLSRSICPQMRSEASLCVKKDLEIDLLRSKRDLLKMAYLRSWSGDVAVTASWVLLAMVKAACTTIGSFLTRAAFLVNRARSSLCTRTCEAPDF
jgi:hypothetical protein